MQVGSKSYELVRPPEAYSNHLITALAVIEGSHDINVEPFAKEGSEENTDRSKGNFAFSEHTPKWRKQKPA